MITVKQARTRASSLLKRNMAAWATEPPDQPVFNLGLRPPTEARAQQDPARADQWVAEWQQVSAPPVVQWVERRWRTLGTQNLPERATIDSPDSLANFAGGTTARDWRLLKRRTQMLETALTEARSNVEEGVTSRIRSAVRSRAKRILGLSDANFDALLGVLVWLRTNTIEGLRPRQLPIRGVDSKWFEDHRALVERLHAAAGGEALGVVDSKGLIRLRVLDPVLAVGGLTDFACTLEELASLDLRPRTVFIFENLESILAMPDWPAALVVHGSGYAAPALGDIPWLRNAKVIYWGDLDADGFAILHALRSHLDDVTSVMMDEATLLAYRDLWVSDPSPNRRELPTLTESEQRARARLQSEGDVRLEQERIPWQAAVVALEAAASGQPLPSQLGD